MSFPQHDHPNVDFVSDHVATVVRTVAGDRLVGIYSLGSLAFGDYVDRVSDMDFIAVVDGELSKRERNHLVAAPTPDAAIGLPGAGLDVIVVSRADAATPAQQPRSQVAVGLFAGWHWQPDVAYDEVDDPGPHLAAASARQTGTSVAGPPPAEVFGPVPRPWLLAACRAELVWWLTQEQRPTWPRSPVLNACRARRCADEGILSSKLGGGTWALEHGVGSAILSRRRCIVSGDSRSQLSTRLMFACCSRLPWISSKQPTNATDAPSLARRPR